LFPLGVVLFPGQRLPLHVFEPRYRQLVADLLALPAGARREFGVVAIRAGHEVGADAVGALHDVGCTAALRSVTPYEDGRSDLVVLGARRFRLRQVHPAHHGRPYLSADVEWLREARPDAPDPQVSVLIRAVTRQFAAYQRRLAGDAGAPGAERALPQLPTEPTVLSFVVSAAMLLDLRDAQRLLAAPSTEERLRLLSGLLRRETALLARLRAVPAADLLRAARPPN
jgi:Lon protease-like protein